MRTFVDTNVLVYLFDSGTPTKQQRARDLVATLARQGALALSTQVLSEFFVTVTRKLERPLPVPNALRALDDLSAFPCVALDAALVRRAALRTTTDQLSHWDALIVEAAIEAGADVLCSEDLQAGRVFQSVRVEDPFAGV